MPLKKQVKLFSNKRYHDIYTIDIICSDPDLKKTVEDIAHEVGASNRENPNNPEDSVSIEFNPSKKLILKFSDSDFAEGFKESLTRNLMRIWKQEFEIFGDESSISSYVRIFLPPGLFPRVRWFVYLFLDGIADKRIGRRWIK